MNRRNRVAEASRAATAAAAARRVAPPSLTEDQVVSAGLELMANKTEPESIVAFFASVVDRIEPPVRC